MTDTSSDRQSNPHTIEAIDACGNMLRRHDVPYVIIVPGRPSPIIRSNVHYEFDMLSALAEATAIITHALRGQTTITDRPETGDVN